MADLVPISTDVDQDRLKRMMALSGGALTAPTPTPASNNPEQRAVLQSIASQNPLVKGDTNPESAGRMARIGMLSNVAGGSQPTAPSRKNEDIAAPTVNRLTPIGGESLPASNATSLQPIGQAAPTKPLSADQTRLQKLQWEDQNPWGSENNHPGALGKLAHIGAKAGNIALDVLNPRAAALIPGTELNRATQEEKLKGDIGAQETRETAALGEKNRERHEENVEDTNAKKLDEAQQKIDETENKDKSAREIALRKQGLKLDEGGNAVPLAPEDMSENERAVHDLKVAQADSATAKAALDRIKADPNSPQNQAALERIRVMAKNAATAAGKLGLDKDKYVADYFGLDKDGNPIPGTTTDEKTGQPIGPRIAHAAAANAPGAERLKRSDLAYNVLQNSGDLRNMIKSNPDLFGKIAGHFTTAQQLIGSDDPNLAKIGIAIHNVALASNGAHGLRSAEAVKETEDKLLNHFRNGPEATMAGLDEIDKSVGSFIEAAEQGKKPMKNPTAAAPAAGGGFKIPEGAPPAQGVPDGHQLKQNGKVVAIAKGGQWQAPQ
jgi:hypothetical protein